MNTLSVFLGFGIGWFLYGLVDLIFSSKKLARKLEKDMSELEIEESCFKYKIGAILYLSLGTIWLVFALITYLE